MLPTVTLCDRNYGAIRSLTINIRTLSNNEPSDGSQRINRLYIIYLYGYVRLLRIFRRTLILIFFFF